MQDEPVPRHLAAAGLVAIVALAGCTVGGSPTTVSEWAQTVNALDADQAEMARQTADSLPCVDGTASPARCAELVASARAFGERVDEVLPAGEPPDQLEPIVAATRRFVDQIATEADAYDEACSGGDDEACVHAFGDVFVPVMLLVSHLDAYDRFADTSDPA